MSKYKILLLLVAYFYSWHLSCDSFLGVFAQKKAEVIKAIGPNKTKHIEVFAQQQEIYRITQILNIRGIGKNGIIKLGKILGYRFAYIVSQDICYKDKIC